MPGSLPPLNALRTFEVAARRLSFSAAARELCVTQGAVSKQIQLLEGYLEQPLFERTPGGLVLTASGRQYLPAVSAAIETIKSATAMLQQHVHASDHLTLNLTPSFSNLWLIPRLNQLSRVLPELQLDMEVGDGTFHFRDTEADMAIRCLPLSLSREHSTLLIEEVLLPVIHPDLLRHHPLRTAADLLAHPLLLHTTRPQLWGQFLRQLGGEGEALPTPRYSHGFEHFYMSLEAARCRQGVALVPDFMAAAAVAAGEVVHPLGIRYRSGYGFYFLVPSYRERTPGIQRFRAWLQQQLNADTRAEPLSDPTP